MSKSTADFDKSLITNFLHFSYRIANFIRSAVFFTDLTYFVKRPHFAQIADW